MNDTVSFYLITDIGSTTTKAILIDAQNAELLGIEHANTTVEAPVNDVKIGIFNSIKALEKSTATLLLTRSADASNLIFEQGIKYLSTSSAGGGLQILVIGLTLFDSASSARRAAYGAGGIILDVFAVNDNRSSVQQMLAMRNLRPDIILLSGGTDGGALSSVLRLAEILRIAKPMPKFVTSEKIPAIYAGNQDAIEMIKRMISEDFELSILPNLRPSLDEENLKPTQEKIQQLFMENVMENAPGYHKLKSVVSQDILPTPLGLTQSLTLLSKDSPQNTIIFDIGGATTDVFSFINGHLQRTVSANLGMSYSALNVLKERGIDELMEKLPSNYDENLVRNYIGNKTLYPTLNPQSKAERRIEHAIAKSAISLAFIQHQNMHYNRTKLGYLDSKKKDNRDKYEEKFQYVADEEKHYFYPSDIELIIGAGGVFAHAENKEQCLDILISGFQPLGISELAIDKHFITPHLGALTQTDPDLAHEVLTKDCIETLAIYVRPIFPMRKPRPVLQVEYDSNRQIIMGNTITRLNAKEGTSYKIIAQKRCRIDGARTEAEFITDLPVIIDTRYDLIKHSPDLDSLFTHYQSEGDEQLFRNASRPKEDDYQYIVELPYEGEIMKSHGESVEPSEIVAVNHYAPPRLFVVNTLTKNIKIPPHVIEQSLTVQSGDEVDFDEILREPLPDYEYRMPHYSPVRGRVEFVDNRTGLVVLSEIQQYSRKPVRINLAERLGVKGRQAARYLKKEVGDFVYEGDLLAAKLSGGNPLFVKTPTTGKIINMEYRTGIVTVHYEPNPFNYFANVRGKVLSIEDEKAIQIGYQATRLDACIGWGRASFGNLFYLEDRDFPAIPEESIVVLGFIPNLKDLKHLSKHSKGIICSSIMQKDAVEYLSMEQGVINTGNEENITPLILLQGFGDLPADEQHLNFLRESSNKLCMIDPHTRIRAGVVRANINVIT